MKGKVEIYYKTKDRERATIIYHEAPFIFGEVEIWGERPYLANVIALEPCEVLEISKKEYMRLLHSNHQLAVNMVKLLSELLWQTGRDRRVRMFGRVEDLLANLLCHYAKLYGEEKDYGILISKEVNKSELAGALGISRQSVIRAFAFLEKNVLVRVDGKQLVIPDLGLLRRRIMT